MISMSCIVRSIDRLLVRRSLVVCSVGLLVERPNIRPPEMCVSDQSGMWEVLGALLLVGPVWGVYVGTRVWWSGREWRARDTSAVEATSGLAV